MPTSQSSSSGSQPGQDLAAFAIPSELADRLKTALELFIAYSYGGRDHDPRQPDPTRVRAAQDYDVVRGLVGRTDAPRALRMRRIPTVGGGGQKGQKGQAGGGDNVIEVVDPVPARASLAVVESPGLGAGPVHEELPISGGYPLELDLTDITAAMTISRVEIFDDDRTLIAFGRSFPAIT